MKNILSIVIATHKRYELLQKCLKSITLQNSRNLAEVIVVGEYDKNLEKEFTEVKFYSQANNGPSKNRNIGWRKSVGSYVSFIDDDAYLTQNWLKNIMTFIKENKNVKVFGGGYQRYSDIPIPTWFPEEYGSLDLGKETKELSLGKEWITGTNLIVKKSLLKRVGGFNESIGPNGTSFGYGEETNLLIRLNQIGQKIYYVPTITVMHWLNPEKMSLSFLLNSYYTMGKTIVKAHERSNNLIYYLLSLVQKIAHLIYFLSLPQQMPLKRRVYYALRGLYSWVGSVITVFS